MTVPYYPGISITPFLGLSLVGMDEVVAENFVLLDAFAEDAAGSIEINGSTVQNPNFVNSATATFSVNGSSISINASGGSGTVTSFSSGALAPLFTASVATPTSTPALSFSLSTQNNNVVFAGPSSGGPLAPTFRALVAGDIPALPYTASVLTTLGDIIYENATPAPARLAGNITTTKTYLSQTGNGSISAAPAWAQIAYADISGTPSSLPPSGSAGGDLSGSYPNPSVIQINGAVIPASKTIVGTNGSGQIVDASSATLANNTSGTAANLSGTPALPNGTTATTQALSDSSGNLATTSFVQGVIAALDGPMVSPGGIVLPFPDIGSATTFSVAGMGVNQGYLFQFRLRTAVKITQARAYQAAGTTAGAKIYFGIYNISGVLLVTISYTLASAPGALTGTVSATTVLPEGDYYYLAAIDTTSVADTLVSSTLTANVANMMNSTATRCGFKASILSSGALATPITVSTFTANAGFGGTASIPLIFVNA